MNAAPLASDLPYEGFAANDDGGDFGRRQAV